MMEAADFLRKMVSIRSFSGEEDARVDFVASYLEAQGLTVKRLKNNIFARVECAGPNAPVVMLCSHLDTVRPSAGYTFDPFEPPYDAGVIRGLGSNDAGGSVAAMIQTALHFYRTGGLDFNILLLLVAEEENSGPNGMCLAIKEADRADCAIIGEPTQMKAAAAERGLLVLDGLAEGISGHAARSEGINALYKAIKDIEILRNYRFAKISPLMGEVKLTVTQIEAGTQHNVVPGKCRFVVDIRPTDSYTNEEILAELQSAVESKLTPRSLKNRSSATPHGHPLLDAAAACGVETYTSPTTSDWMWTGSIPAIKMGPGDSARSHTADEYLTVAELRSGIDGYIDFLSNLKL